MADETDQSDRSDDTDTSDVVDLTPEQESELAAAADDADRADDDRADQDRDASRLGDAGKRALDRMKAERKAARDEAAQLRAELQQFKDKDKTESERLQDTAQNATSRAEKAETSLRALQIAMDRAPDHATLTHVKAVAKRVRGESDDDLESDADELFALLAPKPAPAPKVTGKPVEKLRGGVDPEDELEETDPRKLADAIRRR